MFRAPGNTGAWRVSHLSHDQAVQTCDVGWVLLALLFLIKFVPRVLGNIGVSQKESSSEYVFSESEDESRNLIAC